MLHALEALDCIRCRFNCLFQWRLRKKNPHLLYIISDWIINIFDQEWKPWSSIQVSYEWCKCCYNFPACLSTVCWSLWSWHTASYGSPWAPYCPSWLGPTWRRPTRQWRAWPTGSCLWLQSSSALRQPSCWSLSSSISAGQYFVTLSVRILQVPLVCGHLVQYRGHEMLFTMPWAV